MKYPKVNYLLIPLVGVIWILLLRQFLGTTELEPDNVIIMSKDINLGVWERDSFSIHNDYPDPFMGSFPEVSLHSGTSGKALVTSRGNSLNVGSIIKKPSERIFPEFHYQGGIQRDSTSAIMTGVLRMDNRVFSVQTGETIGALKILSLEIERITFSFQDSVLRLKKE